MKKLYAALSKACGGMDKIILSLSGICLGFLTVLIFVQVVCRYIFHNSLSWSEEIARYLEVWIVFLCGSYAVGHGQHVAMDLLITRVPSKIAVILSKLHACLFIVFSIFFLTYSVQFMVAERSQSMASLRWMPKNAAYLALPLCAISMLIYSLMLLCKPGEEAGAA